MEQILAVDGGNFETKIVGAHGYDCFHSSIGEWRQRNIVDKHSNQDMDFNIVNRYDNIKGFAGPLAALESEYGGTVFGMSKNHLDATIRILLGVARNLKTSEVNLIVGQPYKSHTASEKNEIIASLKGQHTVTINGVTKEFFIKNVLVGVEGGMAFWSSPLDGNVNVIDIGSGTVNCIHFVNKRIVDRKCDTLPFGSETSKSTINYEGMSSAIYKHTSNIWNKNDITLVCGGQSYKFIEPLKRYFPNIKLIKPELIISDIAAPLHTKFANAVGMFNMGLKAFNGKVSAS